MSGVAGNDLPVMAFLAWLTISRLLETAIRLTWIEIARLQLEQDVSVQNAERGLFRTTGTEQVFTRKHG